MKGITERKVLKLKERFEILFENQGTHERDQETPFTRLSSKIKIFIKNSIRMAPTGFNRSYHPSTIEENTKMLQKIASNKVDSHRPAELVKLFAKLNSTENSRSQQPSQSSSSGHQGSQKVHYGPIPEIPPGTWWGIRIDCSRDLVHVPFNEDIETGSFGATSLCTSHSPSNDVDFGDFLTITGAEYSEEILAKDSLIRNCINNVPLRLIRGYNLSNKFAPKTGYRYDGLYVVVGGWIGVLNEKKSLKFVLARLNYQEPPPWQPLELATLKKTRNKSRITQRCHMDCCKTVEKVSSKEKKLENITLDKLSISKPQDKQPKDTIVMRNVLKKSDSTSGVESPILTSAKPTGCKLQNTNISIRTDLYDSSPNPHHDVKRIPMIFCRVYKSSKPQQMVQNKTFSTSSVGVLNLNVFGPGASNKIGESLIQMRSGGGKIADQVTPVLSNRNSTRNQEPSEDSSYFEFKDGEKRRKTMGKLLENSTGALIPLDNTSETFTKPYSLDKLEKSSFHHKKSPISKSNDPNTPIIPQNVKNVEKSSSKNTTELPEDFPSANLHKLECLHSSESTTPKSSKTDKSMVKNLYSLRSSSADKSKKIIEKTESNQKSIVSHPIIVKPNKSVESSSKEVNAQLKTSKKLVNTYSKASSKTKRQNELAKLVIDANFTTTIGGPRTRRFPYAMRGFSKRRDNLKHLKGRSNPKKAKLLNRNTAVKKKNTRIPQNRHSDRNPAVNNERKEKNNFKKPESERILTKKVRKINQTNELTNKSSKTNEIHTINKISEVNKIGKVSEITRNKTSKIHESSEKIHKSVPKSTQVIRQPKMRDASTQCILQRDASTFINSEAPSRSNETPEKHWSMLDEVTSDGSDYDDLEEGYYRNSSMQTTREVQIVRPNCVKVSYENSTRFGGGLSAFVPVNMSDVEFRVARLRSIGFKPIHETSFSSHFGESAFCEYNQGNSNKKHVDEKYKKYTSEENSVVGYMDDELRYQDIEEEVEDGGAKRPRLKAAKELKKTRILKKRKSNDDKVDEPWQGWKKLI